MKQLGKDILSAVLMGVAVPWMVLNLTVALWNRSVPEHDQERPPGSEAITGVSLPVLVRDDAGNVEQQELDAYLVGVVLAEMPASFEEEALKAQSVVARTYARKAYESGGKHGDGSVCIQASCCQAYISEEAYLSRGGTEAAVERIRNAVNATSGQVLLYEGSLIEATYFSCSGGRTEDAQAVWGTDFPYLQAVSSPGEEKAAYYRDTAVFTPEALEAALQVTLTGAAESWTGPVSYTEGGGVDQITIGGETFTGVQLRSLLGLRSTAFEISAQPDAITFITSGYGHRVGMSQYGADAMAVAGSTYREILAHYYQGAELCRIQET